MTNINDMFSPEEVQALKESGTVGAKTVKSDAKGTRPKPLKIIKGDVESISGGWGDEPAPKISPTPMSKVTRPNIPGSGEFVTQTNLGRYHVQDVARKKALAAEQERLEEERKAQSPESLQSQVQYLTRAVKKLQKEVNQLKTQSINHDS